MLGALEESGLADDTLVVLTSDHGEGGAAHPVGNQADAVGGGCQVRVPLLMRLPDTVPENRVDRTHLASGLDLLPTMCGYAGIAAPADIAGQSLRPVIENPALPVRASVVTELQAFMDDETKKGRMIRTARYKYIAFSHGQRPEMLFDLENDPDETENLAYQAANRGVLTEHSELLRKEVEKTADPFVFPA